MLPAADVHVSTKILNQFLDELEQQQTPHVRCCDECNLLLEDGKHTQNELVDKRNIFQIPSIEAITNYIGETPMSLRNDPIFKEHFGEYIKDLEDADLVLECHWPDNIVQVCMVVLLCHAFHCPTVQCCFISDWQLGKGEEDDKRAKADEEVVFELAANINTVLAIGFKNLHYSVIKLDRLERKVMVWDFAETTSHKIAKDWRQHVLAAIKMHFPGEVAHDGHNVFYPSKRNQDLLKDEKMPLWTVQGVVTKYLQTDEYSCGALAINEFAKILRELSNGTILGDGIDD
jgi:hypothetical protein